MTVLNVDDDAEDREIFFEAIQKISPAIECILLGEATAAYKLLSNKSIARKIDYIFLDINMPKMNGFELLEIIKKDKQLEEIPVYMFSTSRSEKEIARTNSLGAKFIQKQSDFKTLVRLLSAILLASNEKSSKMEV